MNKLLKQYILTLIFALVWVVAYTQQSAFLRIYTMTGTRQKGYFARTTDSSVFIYKKSTGMVEIPATNISYIKTNRSVVHGILVGTVTGVVPITVLGTAPVKSHYNQNNILNASTIDSLKATPVTNTAASGKAENITGLSDGVGPAVFAKRTTFIINGNLNKWRSQKKMLEMLADQ